MNQSKAHERHRRLDDPPNALNWDVANGADVVDAHGERLGYVVAVYSNHLLLTRGLLLTDYIVPFADVASFDRSTVHLRTEKTWALDRTRRAGAWTANDERCLWRHHASPNSR